MRWSSRRGAWPQENGEAGLLQVALAHGEEEPAEPQPTPQDKGDGKK